MTSHQVAKILLEKPNAPLVIKGIRGLDEVMLKEVSSVGWTNCGHFMDEKGFDGENDYNSGRECVEIQ